MGRVLSAVGAVALHVVAAFLWAPLPRTEPRPELTVRLETASQSVPAPAPQALPRPPKAVPSSEPVVQTSPAPQPEAVPATSAESSTTESGVESAMPSSPGADRADAYRQAVREAVAQQKAYPNAARVRGQKGTTVVRFVLDAAGVLREPPAVLRSSGFARLDEAARTAVSSARFPPPPAGFEASFDLAVEFVLDSSP